MMETGIQLRDKPTDIQAIRAYYSAEEEDMELTPHQELVRERLLKVAAKMVKGHPVADILKMLKKDYGLSRAQGYRDLKNAPKIYADIRKTEKEGIRWILFDMQMAEVRKCIKEGNRKQFNAGMANLIRISGIDKDEVDLPDFEKLEPSIIVATLDAEVTEFFQSKMKKGPLDLNAIAEAMGVQNTDYEEVQTDDTGGDQGSD